MAQAVPCTLLASDSGASPISLASLRGLRSAPCLDSTQRQRLRGLLQEAVAGCQWFTLGVMATDRQQAIACLRACEAALGWAPLREEPSTDPGLDAPEAGAEASVFLKGNQRSGSFRLRREAGLGRGLLITGHNPDDPALEDTWGPLPLDLFADAVNPPG
jgi:hypothetical protein